MINFQKRNQRADEFRKWYYGLPTRGQASAYKRQIMQVLKISEGTFYKLLRGYTYIDPYRQRRLTQIIGKEIFV